MERKLTRIGCGITGIHDGIRGDVSGIIGDVSGICGNVSGIRGNLDECEIADDERADGVDVSRLVSPCWRCKLGEEQCDEGEVE